MSVDLRPQEPEGLKVAYGLKLFYLAENEKPFFTQWYANGKDVIFGEHEISDVDSDHWASCFGKYSHDGNKE